ncbi:MAG: rod shape-determining protein MreD [Pseudomonadota bacterium]
MKTLLPLLVALLAQAVCTALAALLQFEDLRLEPAVAVLTFTAVRLDPLAGALGASAVGLGTDLMAGAPPGLHMLAFTIVYLLARALSEILGVHRGAAALPLALVLSAGMRLLVAALLALVGDAGARVAGLGTQLVALIFDGLIAVPLWFLLERLYGRLADDTLEGWKAHP